MISVIIPAYNCEKTLEETVCSILDQTYGDFEIIIINDSSTDKTEELSLELCKKDSRIQLKTKPNGGVSSARNYGIECAEGEYICFVDSDDKAEPEYLETLVSQAKDKTLSSVGYVINENGLPPNHEDFGGEYTVGDSFADDFLTGKLRHSVAFAVWNKLFSAKVIKKYNLRFCEELRMGEDMLFVLQYLFRCEKIAYCGKPLYHYNIHPSSAVRSAQSDILEQYEYLLSKIKDPASAGGVVHADTLRFWALESLTYTVSNRYVKELSLSELSKYCRDRLFNSELYAYAVKCKRKCSFMRSVFRFELRTRNSLLLFLLIKGIKG